MDGEEGPGRSRSHEDRDGSNASDDSTTSEPGLLTARLLHSHSREYPAGPIRERMMPVKPPGLTEESPCLDS